ncbi:MAG: cytochrome ubiquinol oxidase subunit I [Desulfofustis sp. PB-SRB1]|nr:cytochrome ubiquinol oxidase subunit I [Desulfofustis sp. PB-SRB1]
MVPNWATYSRFVGDVFAVPWPLREFSLFSSNRAFLPVVAFGRTRVARGFYLFSVYMVATWLYFSRRSGSS